MNFDFFNSKCLLKFGGLEWSCSGIIFRGRVGFREYLIENKQLTIWESKFYSIGPEHFSWS